MNNTEAFESWARAAGFHDLDVDLQGRYVDDFLQHCFLGWEAARTQDGGVNIDMTRNAKSKIEQMGGTPCGVLARNEAGSLAAVSDMGRVTWMDDATPQPANDSLQEVADKVCGHVPEDMVISLCMENGAAWVELGQDRVGNLGLPDSADKTLVEQINDALCVANGWTAPPTEGAE